MLNCIVLLKTVFSLMWQLVCTLWGNRQELRKNFS